MSLHPWISGSRRNSKLQVDWDGSEWLPMPGMAEMEMRETIDWVSASRRALDIEC